MIRPAVLLATLFTLLVAAGCAPVTDQRPSLPSATDTETAPANDMPSVPPAGLERRTDDTARAAGVLVYKDLEGGFYALVDAPPGDYIDGSEPIVVVLADTSGASGADFASLAGSYVEVDGTIPKDQMTTRMAGPEMTVESFRILAPPAEAVVP